MGVRSLSISSRSVLVRTKENTVKFVGFEITRHFFQGINEVTVQAIWNVLVDKFKIISMRVTKASALLMIGTTEPKYLDISSIEKILGDNLPRDCEYRGIEGYNIPLAVLQDVPQNLAYLEFQEINLLGTGTNFLKALLDFPEITLVLGSYQSSSHYNSSILLEISGEQQVDIINKVTMYLRNTPQCQGTLELLSETYMSRNRGLLLLGIGKSTIDINAFDKILKNIHLILKVNTVPEPPEVYPPLELVGDPQPDTSLLSSPESPITKLQKIIRPLAEHHSWIISQQEHYSGYARLLLENREVSLDVYYFQTFDQIPASLQEQKKSQGHMLPVLLCETDPPEILQNGHFEWYRVHDIDFYPLFSMYT